MKKAFILFAIVVLTSCGNGGPFQSKKDTVFVSKPKITDSTVLKAHLEVRAWNTIVLTIIAQANKIGTPIDAVAASKAKDSVNMAVNAIVKALNDSAVNKPYF